MVTPAQVATDITGNGGGGGEIPAAENGDRQQHAAQPVHEQQRRVLIQKSVLDRFRDFHGPWIVPNAIKLFQQDEMLGCRQVPQVVFSDGATTAMLTIIVSAGADDRPVLTMENGMVLSVIKDRESTNAWIVKVRPDKDAVEASLRVDDGVSVRSIPLTVSPRMNVDLDGSGTVTEKDFVLYFYRKGPDARFAEGRNYRVDYIFAANYLAAAGQPTVQQTMTAR